ncbi:MAG: AsnC family protein [Nitrososphaerota archaeon]|nr:AsnC family protein [Nitrososphaerota archaeon]
MKSTPTENPVAYAFSHPEAKRILKLVQAKGRVSYPEVGTLLHMYGETVHRTVRRLAQFNLVRVRAAPGARFHRSRIPLVIEPSHRTEDVCRVLAELDQVLLDNQQRLGARTVQRLAVLA